MDLNSNNAESAEQLAWYAVRVKGRSELQVAAVLAAKGMESYVPTYIRKKQTADRRKVSEMPLFTGYVFSRFDVNRRLPVLLTPQVLQILGIGKNPVPIPNEEIENLSMLISSNLPPAVVDIPAAGDRVRIEEGPLAGVEGIVTRSGGNSRLCVTVTILRRAVSVELEQSWVKAAV